MSRLRYDQQSQGGGGVDGPKAILLAAGLVVLAPAVLLGLAGAFTWRRVGWRRRTAVLLFLASLAPATASAYYWHTNPVLLFLQAHLSVVGALMLMAIGRGGSIPTELTPALYAVAIAPAVLPLAFLVAAVAGWLGRPKTSLLQQRQAEPIAVPRHVERRASGGVTHPTDGFALGYRADGKPVTIADAEARQHVLVCGSTGAGKTTAIRHILDGVAPRCPVVLVDCKASPGLRRAVEAIPGSLVWTIGGELQWDALRGDPTCFASKMLAAEPFSPNGAIYRASAERYVQWVARVLEWTHSPRDPRAIARLLEPKTLAMRLRELRADAPAAWWDRHGEPIARNVAEMGKAEEEGVAGFKVRFGSVVEGVAGDSLGAGDDALVLEDAVRAGRVVLFSLDAAAYPSVAAKIGAWVLLDLVRVAGLLQAEERPFYAVVDEFSALGAEGRHVVPLLARAREAGAAVVLATQGLADLERVDRALPQQIVQNTAVRVLLRQQSSDDALAWARHLGELEREEIEPALRAGGSVRRDAGDRPVPDALAARLPRAARGAAGARDRRGDRPGRTGRRAAPPARAGAHRPARSGARPRREPRTVLDLGMVEFPAGRLVAGRTHLRRNPEHEPQHPLVVGLVGDTREPRCLGAADRRGVVRLDHRLRRPAPPPTRAAMRARRIARPYPRPTVPG